MCLLLFSLKVSKMGGSGSMFSHVFIAILEQLSQYPRGNNAVSLVKIRGVPKSGLFVVLGGSRGVFGLPLGTLWSPFGLPWAPFGLLWEALGIPWGHFGTTLGLLRGTLKVFGGSFGCLWDPPGHLFVHLV